MHYSCEKILLKNRTSYENNCIYPKNHVIIFIDAIYNK